MLPTKGNGVRSSETSYDDPNVSSPAVEAVASDDDLLTEILLRLPVRPLLRFKSVSKHWFSLITDPSFSLRHTIYNPHPSPSGLFLYSFVDQYGFLSLSDNDTPLSPPFKTLTFPPDPSTTAPFWPSYKIRQSCNGLLVCESTEGGSIHYYVYNPTTNQFKTHLKSGSCDLDFRVLGVSLAFEPTKSPHYKIVSVQRMGYITGHNYRIEIYSSETDHWHVSSQSLSGFASSQFSDGSEFASSHFGDGVYWNGAIHWINNLDQLLYHIEQDLLQPMSLPPVPEDWNYNRVCYFGESRGHLHLIDLFPNPFNVYELERDYSGWLLKYRFELHPVAPAFPGMILQLPDYGEVYQYHFLSIVRGDTEEESFLVLDIPGAMIQYNLVDKTFTKLCDSSDWNDIDEQWSKWHTAFPFIESLSCVGKNQHL